MELEYWITNHTDDTGHPPTDTEIQLEACRIIRSADILSTDPSTTACSSWLRDLVLSCKEIARAVMFQSVRGQKENRMSTLRINGKDNIFQDCACESELRQFTLSLPNGGRDVANWELQVEADRILRRAQQNSIAQKDNVLNWLLRLVYNSTDWMADFRNRTLEASTATAADDDEMAGEGVRVSGSSSMSPSADAPPPPPPLAPRNTFSLPTGGFGLHSSASGQQGQMEEDPSSAAIKCAAAARKVGFYELNDANSYHRLVRGLTRFVRSSMSEKNPNRHVPSDEEIQQQARWLEYGE